MRVTPQMFCIATAGFLAGVGLRDMVLTSQTEDIRDTPEEETQATRANSAVTNVQSAATNNRPAAQALGLGERAATGVDSGGVAVVQRLRFPSGERPPSSASNNGTLLILSPVRNRYV